MRLIFLIREQSNIVECRLGFGFEACILTLVLISNEIDEKFVFYHLSHTQSWKMEVENTLFLVHNHLLCIFFLHCIFKCIKLQRYHTVGLPYRIPMWVRGPLHKFTELHL